MPLDGLFRRTQSCHDLGSFQIKSQDEFASPFEEGKIFIKRSKQEIAEVPTISHENMILGFAKNLNENPIVKTFDPSQISKSPPKFQTLTRTRIVSELPHKISQISLGGSYAITYPGNKLVAVHSIKHDEELFTLDTPLWTTAASFMGKDNIAYINKDREAVCIAQIPAGQHLKCADFKVYREGSSVAEIPETVSDPEYISEPQTNEKKPVPIQVKGFEGALLTLYKSFSKDNKDGLLYFWSVQNGTFTKLNPKSFDINQAILLAPDKLISPQKEKIRISNTSKIPNSKKLIGHWDTVNSLSLSSDGFVLASGSKDKTIRLWDLPRFGEECGTIKFENEVKAIEFHPSTAYLIAAAVQPKTIYFLDTRSKKPIESSQLTFMDKNQALRSLRWNEDNEILYAQVGLQAWLKLTDEKSFF
jgi:hypothetical protein